MTLQKFGKCSTIMSVKMLNITFKIGQRHIELVTRCHKTGDYTGHTKRVRNTQLHMISY